MVVLIIPIVKFFVAIEYTIPTTILSKKYYYQYAKEDIFHLQYFFAI
jgi:hypothetical protein